MLLVTAIFLDFSCLWCIPLVSRTRGGCVCVVQVNLLKGKRHSSIALTASLISQLSYHLTNMFLAPTQFLKLAGLFLSHFSFQLEGNYNV